MQNAQNVLDKLIGGSSMKFLSTWLRNSPYLQGATTIYTLLNEVPEHMAQE